MKVMLNGEEMFNVNSSELVRGFLEANTTEDQKALVMAASFMLHLKENSRCVATVNLSRDRKYIIGRSNDNIIVSKKGGYTVNMNITKAKKFVAALGKFTETAWFESDHILYFHKMVSCIA